jgi:hypothetical protein
MKLKIRHIAALTILAVGATAVLSWPSLLKYIVQSTLTEIRGSGVALSWNGVSTSMTSVKLEHATGWLPVPAAQRHGNTLKIPISFDLQRLSVEVQGTSLLTLAPRFPFTAALYGGTVTGETQPLGSEPIITVAIDNVELGQHPQLAALGVQGGVISGSTKGLRLKKQQPPEGSFTLAVANLTPPAAVLPSEHSHPIAPVDLSTSGSIKDRTLVLDSLKLSSPLGAIESSGKISGLQTPSAKFNATTHISLAETTIPALVPQIKYILGDERFPDIDLSWRGTLEGGALSLETLKVATIFGNGDGRAKVARVESPQPAIDGNIRINLSEKGVSMIGKWLPLLTGGAVEASATTFRINFLSAPCEQSGAQRLFDQVCLKASFAE